MNWNTFWASVGAFFSSVGSIFLSNIKAAIPVLEQAASNFLSALVAQIIADIENGTIPLPSLAAAPGAPTVPVGDTKRSVAFNTVKQKLATTNVPPSGMTISDSLIYWQIETSLRAYKNKGNGGVLPGGNSGPVSK